MDIKPINKEYLYLWSSVLPNTCELVLRMFLSFRTLSVTFSEGRVYNPDVTRNALDFIKRKISEDNWTEMTW